MSSQSIERDESVLIVGAGPSGLILALQCLRYNINFRIIEKKEETTSIASKALTIQPSTLMLLDDLGLANDLIKEGYKTHSIQIYFEHKLLTRINIGGISSKFPFMLSIPQPATETILKAALIKAGVRIEYGTSLEDLKNKDAYVRTRIKYKDHLSKQADFRFVVGCDGKNSTVRKAANIGFSGYDYDMHFLLADLKIEWNKDVIGNIYYIQRNGFIILLPLPNGYHRVVIKVAGQRMTKAAPTLDELESYLFQYKIFDLKLRNPKWLSWAPFFNRIATSIKYKNILLSGDSSHLFSPIGGFGMNTGIADSFNLGWRLGAGLNGFNKFSFLKTYAHEREKIANELVQFTDSLTSVISRLNRHAISDETRFLPLMENRKFLAKLPYIASGLENTYEYYSKLNCKKLNSIRIHSYSKELDYWKSHNNLQGKFLLILNLKNVINATDYLRTISRASYINNFAVLVSGVSKSVINNFLNSSILYFDINSERIITSFLTIESGEFALIRPDYYVSKTGLIDDFVKDIESVTF